MRLCSRTFGGVRILLLGDLGVSGQAALLEQRGPAGGHRNRRASSEGEPLGQALVE